MVYLPYLHIFFMATAVILAVTAAIIARRKGTGWYVLHRRAA
jgi:hypothetical protein